MYGHDEWYDDGDYDDVDNDEEWCDDEAERQEEEFRARPFRFFYKFKTRDFDDIGAGYEVDAKMLGYLRGWAETGELEYWKIVRVADDVTLANWERRNA